VLSQTQPPTDANADELRGWIADMAFTFDGDPEVRGYLLKLLPTYPNCLNPSGWIEDAYNKPRLVRNEPAVRRSRTIEEMSRDPRLTEPIIWDLPLYTGAGLVSLLYSMPKRGKNTWANYYLRARAGGGRFMGTDFEPAHVLIVAPDEPDRIRYHRYATLGMHLTHVHDWQWRSFLIPEIAEEAHRVGAKLVFGDTLLRIAHIEDENNNAAWDSWFAEHLPTMRELDVPWLFSAHERKAGGEHGEGVRGGNAIIGCVDIGFTIRLVPGNKNQRVLRMEGTRLEEAPDTLVELNEDEDEYRLIGSAWKERVVSDVENQKIMDLLRDGQPRTTYAIAKELDGVRSTITRKIRDKLVPGGFLSVTDTNPFTVQRKFSNFRPPSTPKGGGLVDERCSVDDVDEIVDAHKRRSD
jgi:hypothetical protein